jgi:hypothetical protein
MTVASLEGNLADLGDLVRLWKETIDLCGEVFFLLLDVAH